jgi:YHS domain-containing protein
MMDWLTQNWVWIVFAIGAVRLFKRGGLAGYGMGGHGGHAGHGGGTEPAPGGSSSGAGPEKARDPVSGREVLTGNALTAVYRGRVFYFESPENRERFEGAPAQYAPQASQAQQHRHHGC